MGSPVHQITASDYYQFDDLLTPDEKETRQKVRKCMEKEVAPIMAKVLTLFLAAILCHI